MTRYSHNVIFLFLFSACTVFMHGEDKAVHKFPYRKYIGKPFGEFHQAFKLNCEKETVATDASLFRPKIISIEGITIQVGHEYTVRAFFLSEHYMAFPDWSAPADSSICNDWNCPEFDTALVGSFEVLKNGQPCREYK